MAGHGLGPKAYLPPASRTLSLAGWAAAALLVYTPILRILSRSFLRDGRFSLEAYADLVSPRVLGLLLRSAALAAGATVLALVLGTALALLVETRRIPCRPLLRLAALAPLLLPPYMQVAAWRPLLSSWAIHSEAVRLPAVVWILGISLAPLVFFFASQGIRGISGDLLDAARTLGVQERTIALRIILPLAAPMISTGAAIAFVLALLDQETPSLLLVPAYSTEIFLRMGRGPGAAFAASVPVILLAAVLVTAAWSWARRRGFSVTAGENPRTPFPARRIDPLAVAVLLASFGLLVLFPLVRLLQMAGSARIFQEAWALYGPAFLEAVPVTLGGALGATVLAALILGRCGETGTAGALLAWIPLAVPGTALAAAFIEAWNRPGLDAVYKSPWILVAAGAVRLFPIAFHALAAHLRTVPPALWEAADLAAVPAPRRFLRVWLPLAAPGLALASCAGVVLQVGEVAAAVLLAPPGHRPPSVVISAELHYNVNLDVPAALCLFQVAAVLMMIACIRIPARLLAPAAARDGG